MPLNGRQATELIFLSGLATSAPAGDLNTNKNYPTVTISVAGGQANGITYIMDGGTHNDPFNNLNLPTPFPDALQEFKVETSSLPARYGHHAASAVNLVTKSGTNALPRQRLRVHPRLSLQRAQLLRADARQPQAQPVRRHARRPRDQGQAVLLRRLPGPGREIESAGNRQLRADRQDAGRRFHRGGRPGVHAAHAVGRRPGFVNNTINPAAFSPIALKFLEHVPVVHRSVRTPPVRHPEQQHRAPDARPRRLHAVGPARPCSAATCTRSTTIPATYDGKNVLTLSRTGQNNQVHSFVGGHNWVLSSTMVNAFHVTYNKTINDRPMPLYFSPADLGSAVYSPQPGYMGVSVTNGFNIGTGGTNPGYFNSDSLQIANDIDLVRGRHQLSFGGNWIRTKIETVNNRPTNGQFTFNGQTIGSRPRRFHARPRQQLPAGQPGVRLRRERLHRRLRAGRMEAPAEPDAERRAALGAVSGDQELARLRQQLRRGAVRRRDPEHGVPAGAGRPAVPRRRGIPRVGGDEQQARISSPRARASSGR